MLYDPNEDFYDDIETEYAQAEQEKQIESELQYCSEADFEAMSRDARKMIATNSQAPQTPEELYKAIEVLLGFSYPYTVTDTEMEHACSPFEWFWRIYSGEWLTSFGWASRGGAKTLMMAHVQAMLSTFFSTHSGLHFSFNKNQAKFCKKYIDDYYKRKGVGNNVFTKRPSSELVTFRNDSYFQIIAGAASSYDGQHVATLSVDEVKWMSEQNLNQAWGVPMSMNGLVPRLVMGSTNQFAGSGVSYVLKEADKRRIKIAKWMALDTMIPCTAIGGCKAIAEHPHVSGPSGDVARENSCVMWKKCRGELGMRSTGWKTREEIEKFVIELGGPDTPECKTQAYCEAPSTDGLVLYNFEPEYKDMGGNFVTLEYDASGAIEWYAFMDPAEGNKAVIGFWHYYVGARGPAMWQFDELVIDKCASDVQLKLAFYEHCHKMGYSDPKAIVVDPRKTDAINDFRYGTRDGAGLEKRYNAVPAPCDEASGGQEIVNGIKEVRRMIEGGDKVRRLFINPDKCPRTVYAVQNWSYKRNADGALEDGARVSEHLKDENDMVRYGVRYVIKVLMKRDGTGINIL